MKHIKTESEDDRSWCNTPLSTDMYFKNAEAAALYGMYDKKPTLCPECVEMVTACLRNASIIDE